MSTPTVRFPWILLIGLLATACIADTKLPPEPTIQYLPCSSMELAGPRTEPGPVFDTSTLWGGYWTIGDEWHIGIIDPGAVDWDETCQTIGDPLLVVHEVPHTLDELEGWSDRITAQMNESSSVTLTVVNGQYVLEVRARNLADAADATQDVPLTAWVYGGALR